MKLTAAERWVICLTMIFLALTIGYRIGRGSRSADYSVRTEEKTDAAVVSSERSTASHTELQEATQSSAPSGKVNINTAGVEELTMLDGIGEVLAQRIIAYRTENGPFGEISEIQNVEGIGSGIFEKVQGQITVE